MAAGVEVSVEALNEWQIQEVALDGQEIYTQPLSMTENLTKLAHKIDFSKDEEEGKGKPTSEADKEEEEEKQITPFQPSQWPWDSVRNTLKAAMTEVNVLYDVVNIAHEKRFMVLDPVQQDPPDPKLGLTLVAKKRAASSAATILSSGGERLRRSLETSAKRTLQDFYNELLKLRTNWRLKKVGNVILGDLSYKSAGSRYWQNGTFEVTKSDFENDPIDSPTAGNAPRSVLQVTIPSELEGVAYIQVAIKKLTATDSDGFKQTCFSCPDQTVRTRSSKTQPNTNMTSRLTESQGDLASAELSLPNNLTGSVPAGAHWQRKLEAAQNVIFCKEVFAQLAREAVQIKSHIPHIVVGNQIFSHLLPGFHLSIALCHYTDKDKRVGANSPPKSDHNHVLEHSLHQLLRETHHKNSFHPMPHPVTALLGMSKRRCLAGPHAFSRTELMDMTDDSTLLEQIIKQARHMVVREKAIRVLDEIAQEFQDPQVAIHWSNISSSLECMIKVCITSTGYENVKNPWALHLALDKMKVVCKDGRVMHLSHEEQELRDFVLCQIAQHHINTVQHLSKIVGWHILSINSHVGTGNMEPMGNAHSILLSSPHGDRVLSIRSGPVSGLQVSVQMCPRKASEVNGQSVIRDSKWNSLGGPFRDINMAKLEGRNFANKIELLMAALTRD